MRIAMVSEHASPLAALGGVDAGGQNVYVARLAEELAGRGHDVTVYTRRDATDLPARVPLPGGAVVEHVPAGPPVSVPKDELFPHMPAFGAHLARAWARERPDVVHAHFWMSGMAAQIGAAPHGVPLVQTFHALGTVKRRHQGMRDTSPYERIGIERQLGRTCERVLATCTDEVVELGDMGVPTRQVSVVPCGVDAEHFHPAADTGRTPERRLRHRLLACGRLVPRKGYDQAVRALAHIPDAELLIAGGPPAGALEADPEARRLTGIARRAGVADRV
ncbi:glycosyltransferase, partial [Streptomyces rubrogriseus]